MCLGRLIRPHVGSEKDRFKISAPRNYRASLIAQVFSKYLSNPNFLDTMSSTRATLPSRSTTALTKPKVITAEEPVQVAKGGRKGTVKVEIQLGEYTSYKSCKRIDVDIFQKPERARGWSHIGFLIGAYVDKDLKRASNKTSTPLWVEELLQQDDQTKKDDMYELRRITRFIFNKTGDVSDKFGHVSHELTSNAFVFIDTYKLYTQFRIRGAGVQPMRMLLDLLPQVLGEADQVEIPCILEPAHSAGTVIDNGMSSVEIEAKLMKSYRKSGFDVWVQGDPEDDSSMSVMGRTV